MGQVVDLRRRDIAHHQTVKVHRRYHGSVLVIVTDGLKQGFVFEPGTVILDYEADPGSHPRDPRQMTMTITGIGRMAAAMDFPPDAPALNR
jgi:hypothetical protein